MKMANYLDGVELLDLDLDPGDVVVVEVLHLLQLVFQPVFVVSCGKDDQGEVVFVFVFVFVIVIVIVFVFVFVFVIVIVFVFVFMWSL